MVINFKSDIMKHQLNFLIIFTIFDGLRTIIGLELNGKGVCTREQEVSINGSTTHQTVLFCCKGYKLDAIKDICTPICTRMCIQGICTAPDTCSCKPGYHQDPRNKNMCNAVCSHGCINGFCSSPEVCRCNNGFAPNPENDNKCTKLCTTKRGDKTGACTCDKGFTKIEETNFCGAICNTPCINADCAQPENCICWKGFSKDGTNRNQCNPMCKDINCENGVCTGYNECTCHAGFVKGGNNTCEEVLQTTEMVYSKTTQIPEVVDHSEVFYVTEEILIKTTMNHQTVTTTEISVIFENPEESNKSEETEINCSKPCLNGECTGTNVCTCNEGYQKDSKDFFNCLPICSGLCENGYCSEPDTCTCKDGFTKIGNSCLKIETTTQKQELDQPEEPEVESVECSDGICVPLPNCTKPCINGDCSGTNTCLCKEGYKVDPEDIFNCLPTCSEPCKNGYCSKPNECSCNEGYIMNKHSCEAICDPPCEFGNCIAPNQCTCQEGYQEDTTLKCQPICTNCTNGICSGPEVCTCNKGYVTTYKGSCKPFCKHDCINGECSAPDKCICKPGYSPNGNNTNDCHPKCPKTCINGYCSEPDTCICNKGYKMDLTNKYVCKPTCSKPCINGECLKLDTCSCFSGYSLNSKNKFQCDPICSKDCINGHCTGPETCTCKKGYEDTTDPFVCNPTCLQPCINGTCSGIDTCECLEGFKLLENDTFTCVEEQNLTTDCLNCSTLGTSSGEQDNEKASIMSCSRPCINGICTDQDTCTCNPGYEKDPFNKMKCNPFCAVMCINGQCTGPDTCSCRAGYVPDNVTKHICRPTCAEPCENGNCVGANSCACNFGFRKASKYYCEPVCTKPCQNGKCIAPDKCSCNEGFKPEPKDRFKCLSCGNKGCTDLEVPEEPDMGKKDNCEFGMVFNELTRMCVSMKLCEKSCLEGVCQDGACVCNEGFTGETCENSDIVQAGSSMWMIAGIFAGVAGVAGVIGYFANTLRKNWGNTDVTPGTASTAEVDDDDIEKNVQSRDNPVEVRQEMRQDGERRIPVWGGANVVLNR